MKCYDLLADARTIEAHRRLGWDGICATVEFGAEFKKNSENARKTGAEVKIGALLTKDVEKNARKALDMGAYLVLADGRSDDVARAASESWDVDLIVNPEPNEERDLVDQWSSGLDHIMASFMAEREIGYCVNAGNVLHSEGMRRVRLLGRIGQNLMLARKYGLRVVLASGARSDYDVRNRNDLMEVGRMLGMSESAACESICENPTFFIEKASSRSDQDVIMRGLIVKNWGTLERKPKRKYGWY